MKPTTDEVASLIEDARDLIAKGWVTGRSDKKETGRPTRYCLTGALDAVSTELAKSRYPVLDIVHMKHEATRALAETLGKEPYGSELIQFNDSQESKGPVLDLLDKTAKSLRNPEVT